MREATIGPCKLIHGDCRAALPAIDANSIDTILTDPPYGLSFMGKEWDHGVPGSVFWEAALRVAKPGAMLLAFGGTRTFHRLACAIEDAGWELRDTIMWVYGVGFPKSLDISKAIDKAAGAKRKVVGFNPWTNSKMVAGNGVSGLKQAGSFAGEYESERVDSPITTPATDAAREWDGWGTSLKPAYEPIIVAMKPLDGTFANNAITHGVAGFHIDGGRIPANGDRLGGGQNSDGWDYTGKHDGYQRPWMADDEKRQQMQARSRDNTARSESLGRFPANLIHDGSDDVLALFPHTQSGKLQPWHNDAGKAAGIFGSYTGSNGHGRSGGGDSGSAARFFYCAKESSSERGDFNTHPTVKPLALMEYLCNLTKTPTGGTVLDMFTGSGSTGVACVRTGRKFVGIEREDSTEQPFFSILTQRIQDAVDEANKPKPPALFEDEPEVEYVATTRQQASLFGDE